MHFVINTLQVLCCPSNAGQKELNKIKTYIGQHLCPIAIRKSLINFIQFICLFFFLTPLHNSRSDINFNYGNYAIMIQFYNFYIQIIFCLIRCFFTSFTLGKGKPKQPPPSPANPHGNLQKSNFKLREPSAINFYCQKSFEEAFDHLGESLETFVNCKKVSENTFENFLNFLQKGLQKQMKVSN